MQFDRLNIGKAVAETEFEKNLEKSYQRLNDVLSQMLTKGLLFSDNFNAYIVDVTTPGVPDTEFTVAHTLKRIPTGYILLRTDVPTTIYDGVTAWTTTDIYLKEPMGTATIKIMVF